MPQKYAVQCQGVPVSEISDPRPIFQIALLPTDQQRHFACYNDIHKQNLNIHIVNYIHVRFYLCMNIINIPMVNLHVLTTAVTIRWTGPLDWTTGLMNNVILI